MKCSSLLSFRRGVRGEVLVYSHNYPIFTIPNHRSMDSVRQNKIARLMQKELANVFQAESRNLLPGKMITVTVVRVTPDLGLAKVYLSMFPHKNDEDVIGPSTNTIK